jgi:S-DNA-T family DNA segregation ATPase FtsK/SpoIIIE
LCTQKPDSNAIPPPIRDQLLLRLAFRVNSPEANKMALGAGSAARGYDAQQFDDTLDKGLCWFKAGGRYQMMRFAYLDGETQPDELEAVALRARQARIRAGTLTGMAAGEVLEIPEVDDSTILDDLAVIWPASVNNLGSSEAAELLAAHKPDRYQGWTGTQVSQAAGRLSGEQKLKAKKLWIEGESLRGFTRTEFAAAYAALLDERSPSTPDGDLPDVEDGPEGDSP